MSTNQWIDGPDLANERVGGAEGHRRIRELRANGYPIERRPHPDQQRRRGIYQYRLRSEAEAPEEAEDPKPLWQRQWRCETCGNEPMERPVRLQGSFGIARCGTCRSRRYFRTLAA